MANPKEMVDARLRELRMSKATFARKLGYVGYQGYYDLFSRGRTALTPEKLEQIAAVLGWPRDHFQKPGDTLRRSAHIRAELDKFLASEVGKHAHPDTVKILESMQWTGQFLPTATLYMAVTLAMEGHYSAAQLAAAAQLELEDAARESDANDAHAAKRLKRKRSS
jgi:hypothetical protein